MQRRDVKVVILSPSTQNKNKSPGPNTYSTRKRSGERITHPGTAGLLSLALEFGNLVAAGGTDGKSFNSRHFEKDR